MALKTAAVGQVIVLLADGTRPDVLETLLQRGDMPSSRRLFAENDHDRVESLSSAFPTTTGPAHLPFLTGRYPGPCNVPGIRWFDPHRYAASPLSLSRFRSYTSRSPGAPWSDARNPAIPHIDETLAWQVHAVNYTSRSSAGPFRATYPGRTNPHYS